jgi:hypothetical protein
MNEVKIVVTGQYRPSGAVAALKKDLADLAKHATQLEKIAKKSTKELDDGLKNAGNGADVAKEAIAKLGAQADKAFDGLRDKVDAAFKAAEEERIVKVKAEFDKNRLKNSFDGLGGFDIDITSGLGPKLAAAFGKVSDTLGKGVDLAKGGVQSAASFVTGLGDGLKAQHPAVQGAVYATLAGAAALAAPLAGGALAGGIIAGFGAGIGGLGIVAASQSSKVRDSFSKMWDGVVADTVAGSTSIQNVLVRTAGRAQTAWEQSGHMLTNAFANIAPGLESLFDGLLQSLQRFGPALEPMATAASAVFKDLGGRLPGIIGEIADSFTGLASSVEKNPEALGDFIAVAGEFLEVGADVLGLLNDFHAGNKMLFDQLSKPFEWIGLDNAGDSFSKAKDSMLDISKFSTGPMQNIDQAFKAIGKAGDDAAKRIDAVRQALDLLNGLTPDYTEGLASAADAVSALDGMFKTAEDRAKGFKNALLDSSGAFDVTNENGRKLYENVTQVQDSFDSMAAAVANGQVSREQFINDTGRMRDRLNETWRQAGFTEAQIIALNEKYGLTPDDVATTARLIGADAVEAALIRLARERYTTIYAEMRTIGGYAGTVNGQTIYHDRPSAHGGAVAKFASGGMPGGRSNAVVNDWGSQSHGEAIRLPQGSTVIPASMTRSMESRWGTDRGAGQAGGNNTIVVQASGNLVGLEMMFFEWLKASVRRRGGDPQLFG